MTSDPQGGGFPPFPSGRLVSSCTSTPCFPQLSSPLCNGLEHFETESHCVAVTAVVLISADSLEQCLGPLEIMVALKLGRGQLGPVGHTEAVAACVGEDQTAAFSTPLSPSHFLHIHSERGKEGGRGSPNCRAFSPEDSDEVSFCPTRLGVNDQDQKAILYSRGVMTP